MIIHAGPASVSGGGVHHRHGQLPGLWNSGLQEAVKQSPKFQILQLKRTVRICPEYLLFLVRYLWICVGCAIAVTSNCACVPSFTVTPRTFQCSANIRSSLRDSSKHALQNNTSHLEISTTHTPPNQTVSFHTRHNGKLAPMPPMNGAACSQVIYRSKSEIPSRASSSSKTLRATRSTSPKSLLPAKASSSVSRRRSLQAAQTTTSQATCSVTSSQVQARCSWWQSTMLSCKKNGSTIVRSRY